MDNSGVACAAAVGRPKRGVFALTCKGKGRASMRYLTIDGFSDLIGRQYRFVTKRRRFVGPNSPEDNTFVICSGSARSLCVGKRDNDGHSSYSRTEREMTVKVLLTLRCRHASSGGLVSTLGGCMSFVHHVRGPSCAAGSAMSFGDGGQKCGCP